MEEHRRPTSELTETQARAKMEWRRTMATLPLREKVAIVVEMQRRLVPIIAQRRTLQWWERPWEIDEQAG